MAIACPHVRRKPQRLGALVLACGLTMAAYPALADMPPDIRIVTLEMIAACKEVGGAPSLSGLTIPGAGLTPPGYPPYLTQAELNGDDQPDYITDLAGLECVNAWSLFCGSAGCPVTVWLSGPEGHAVAWAGNAQGWTLRGTEIVVFLHGQLCAPPRVGADACEMAMRFDRTPPSRRPGQTR